MTLKKLKEIVFQLISRAKTDEAIDTVIRWARKNEREQLKNELVLMKGQLENLNREKRLGILSYSEVNLQKNKITYGILELLKNENEPGQINIPDNIIANNTKAPSANERTKILMLTANPANTTKLNLDREHSVITQKLQQKQEVFNIILKKAVSGTEFKEFTQREKPFILHFSGHGEKGNYAGIVVQNEDKNEEELIPIKGLKTLFKFLKKSLKIKVVLLNACHTQEQAAAISEYVEYVIGTNVAIGDTAASAFSSGFYFQLAEDEQMNIENAFDSGRTEAVMKGADEENFVIYRKGKLIEV